MPLTQSLQRVTIGQRYRPVGRHSDSWVVIGLTADHAGNPHARLTLDRDHTRKITIAFAGLRDGRLYEQLTETTEHDDGPDDRPAGSKPA